MDMRGSIRGQKGRGGLRNGGPHHELNVGCRVTGGDKRAGWEALGIITAPDQPSPGPRFTYVGYWDFAWRMLNLKLQASEQRAASCQELGSRALTSSGWSNGASLGRERKRLCTDSHGAEIRP